MNPLSMTINHKTAEGRPTLEMIERFVVLQSDSPTSLDAIHYVAEHALGRPLGTLPQYQVTETAEHPACWVVTRRSMLSGCELYKEIENAHADALQEENERNAAACRAMLAEIREDDRKAMAEQDPAYKGPATAPREYVDTPRTYETTSAALELSNTEALYTAARRLISRRLAQTDPDTENRTPAQVAADALKEYVESIMDEQDTRNPHTALLVALANAATCRVDWEDLAHEIAAEIL